MKAHNADIGTICEYEWYEWVMYNATTWKFSEPMFELGQYLGPAIDLGYTMTAKILNKTGEVISRSTFHHLKMDGMENPDFKEQRCKFYEAVIDKIDNPATETGSPEK